MLRLMFLRFIIGATAANALLLEGDEVSEVCDERCQASSGSVLMQKGQHAALARVQQHEHEAPAAAPEAAPQVHSTLGVELEWWLTNKMILPDPWKCQFYNGDWRVCDKDVAQAGLVPGKVTEEGRKSHEYINVPRTHMPVGALPCCPTPPFCSSPKCSDSFLATSASAPPAKCTKRSGAENFAYMTGQQEWPAYMAMCGGYSFDVHKHWDVLNRLLGCHGEKCSRAETFDLVIDMGSNFGMITEELTNRHFAQNYIEIDAAPFAGPDFKRRRGNMTWRETWIRDQVRPRPNQVVPNYEFHQFGITNVADGGTFDPCAAFGYDGGNGAGKPCPVAKASPDVIIPGKLSEEFKAIFERSESAFVKTDVEGYDFAALYGMRQLFQQQRGVYPDGSPKYLINFIMLEYAPVLLDAVKAREGFPDQYDNLKTVTSMMEQQGWEVFLTGPRYLPLTHGSWDDRYEAWFKPLRSGSTEPQCPMGTMYPHFKKLACPGPTCDCTFATDLFLMRASHPKANEIKVALGACAESRDYHSWDQQYDMSMEAQA